MSSVPFAAPQARLAGTSVFKKPASVSSDDAPPTQENHHEERDPHLLPSFTTEGLVQPTEPVLYLPPLLSSLPPQYPHIELPKDWPPLKTETRLPKIDPASLSLHRALHHFKPRPQYAALPYAKAFNWEDLKLPEEEEREWYIVAFRSRRKDGSDGSREYYFPFPFSASRYATELNADAESINIVALYEADRLAHEEAVVNGGVSVARHSFAFRPPY